MMRLGVDPGENVDAASVAYTGFFVTPNDDRAIGRFDLADFLGEVAVPGGELTRIDRFNLDGVAAGGYVARTSAVDEWDVSICTRFVWK